jgi:polyisoprenoid-binding protein YceI
MSATRSDDLSGDYVLDPAHTRLGFIARHAVVARVHGHFEEFTGTAHVDLADPTRSRVEIDIAASSVTTGLRQRDAHLRSGDFFDVDHNPWITYRSMDVSHAGGALFTVAGELTIRGTTEELPLEFSYRGATTDAAGTTLVTAHASTVISRREWGLTWSSPVEVGGIVVADAVVLVLDVSARRVGARTAHVTPRSTALTR